MTYFTKLSAFHQNRILREINLEVEDVEERTHLRKMLAQGVYCAACWRIYYNCVCSHLD